MIKIEITVDDIKNSVVKSSDENKGCNMKSDNLENLTDLEHFAKNLMGEIVDIVVMGPTNEGLEKAYCDLEDHLIYLKNYRETRNLSEKLKENCK